MHNVFKKIWSLAKPKHSHTISLGEPRASIGEIEREFKCSDGWAVPVGASYRYKQSAAWLNYCGLAVLQELKKRELLDEAGKKMLVHLRGTRTISESLESITERTKPYFEAHRELFLFDTLPNLGKRVTKPDADQINEKANREQKVHSTHVELLKRSGWTPTSGRSPKVLEIGYISGGESLVAFERLGFETHGIDYFFDGQFDEVQPWKFVQHVTGTKTGFHVGDITQETSFEAGSFDLIYSAQTIEHIRDLKAAFHECNRLLRPGGAMLHIYDPYFHPLGGHAFGMLDSPWGHMQLDRPDTERYLRELRPHEAETCIEWTRNSLNPGHTQRHVQHELVAQGFALREWHRNLVPQTELEQLSPSIIQRAFSIRPDVTLDDLITKAVRFVAIKPMK